MGEFKPEDESTPEPITAEKSNKKILVENKEKSVDSLSHNETLNNNTQNSIKIENELSNETSKPDTTDVCRPVNKPDDAIKENDKKHITPMTIVESHTPPLPPQPVKRRVRILKLKYFYYIL